MSVNLEDRIAFAPCWNMERLRATDAVALYSGGFDPLHGGHYACIGGAAQFGSVVLIANNDDFLTRKKSRCDVADTPLFPEDVRQQMLANIPSVAAVILASDVDDTVCRTIDEIAEAGINARYFVNGGDRKVGNVPEQSVCEKHLIEMRWGVGGDEKQGNSSGVLADVSKLIDGRIVSRDAQATRWGGFCTVRMSGKDPLSPAKRDKVLWLRPEGGVSLQTHREREEEWRCLEGCCLLALGALDAQGFQRYDKDGQPVFGECHMLKPGMSVRVACGQAHMAYAPDGPATIFEQQRGCCHEDDIERFGDPFTLEDDIDRCVPWLGAMLQARDPELVEMTMAAAE